MNYQLGDHVFLWTNPLLQGVTPPPGGLGPNESWMNWGGDKLWLAPQGWESENQWPGPPDPVLDGGSFNAELMAAEEDVIRIRVTSQPDRRSGVQLSRLLSVEDGSTRLRIVSTMTNISDRPRQWSIWPVTQIDAASRRGEGWNAKLRTCVPLNARSIYPRGYKVFYGREDNPQYAILEGVLEVRYQHLVGKIGLDSEAGWVAILDGETGNVLVQQTTILPDVSYADGASIEVWTNGRGTLTAYGRTEEMPEDLGANPYMLECELVSPLAHLRPGESFEFSYSWAAANIGEDSAVRRCIRSCSAMGCEVEAFSISRRGQMRGRYGVFCQGECWIEFIDEDGSALGASRLVASVSPISPLLLTGSVAPPERACGAILAIYRKDAETRSPSPGRRLGELGRATFNG